MGFITQNKGGLGQLRLDTDGPWPGERQRRRGGELGSRFVCTWTCRDEKCQEAPFAAIAQNLWREGLHIMTASMRLVHEGCGSGHFTVGGADNDLRKALTIARHGPPGVLSSAYTGASRAGVSLKTRDKCGLGQLRLATDGPGPGERQRMRGGDLRAGNSASWHVLRDKVTRGRSSLSAHHLAFSVALLAQAHQYQV